jgi:hypothetical protein
VSIRGFSLAVDLLSVKPLEDHASTSEMLKATVLGEFFECLRRLSTLPFGAGFMFFKESVRKKRLRPPFSPGSFPAWSGRMCRPAWIEE